MWKNISAFELRYQLRQPLAAVSAAVFFLLALALATSDAGAAIGDAPGTTLRNAPIVIVRLMPVLNLLGLFAMTAFVASAALRDFERDSHMLFFTKPIRKLDYLLGRFLGSMAVSGMVLLVAILGLAAGGFAPWQPAERVGPFLLQPFLFGILTLALPNLLLMGALFFALAAWTRRPTVTYLCVVFFIGMQDAIEIAAEGLENRWIGSLLEPSGLVALETVTRNWTVAEQNTRLPELSGPLLVNRLLWLTLALLLLATSFRRFNFTDQRQGRSRHSKEIAGNRVQAPAGAPALARSSIQPTAPATTLGPVGDVRRLLAQTRLELSEVLPTAPFLVLLAIGLLLVTVFAFVVGSHDGMPSVPLTHLMVQAIGLATRSTLVLVLVLYAGELVFSQRSLRISQVYDALPVPSSVLLAAKILALFAITSVSLLASAAAALIVQSARGGAPIDLGLYVRGLLAIALPLALLAVMAVFLQVLTNHKLLGFLMATVALLARFALPRLGVESNFLLYARPPSLTFSDLNGYGHHAQPFMAYLVYWSFLALILWTGALLLWPRGTRVPWRDRLTLARRRLRRSIAFSFTLGILGMAGTGAWILAQSHAPPETYTRGAILARLADYERSYSHHADLPRPSITSVFAEVDIHPAERRVVIRGRYQLENPGSEPIRLLPITRSPRWVEGVQRVYGGVEITALELPPHTVIEADDELGFTLVELASPLAAGARMDLGFTVEVDHSAFVAPRHNDLVVENGTFFTSRSFFPFLGYAHANAIRDPVERRRFGLPPIKREADLDDRAAQQHNYLGADWVDFEAIVSTAGDQIAIAPGELERSWQHGTRNYFHYKTSRPITNLLPFHSGRYETVREAWNGVELEIYFHPGHGRNIERFLETTRHSLSYLSKTLGPYPHPQLRIVEIPSYHGKIAFSLAQTIAVSESWLFSADLDHAELDWLAAIHAHEVAHQWWNHQVVPAGVQGATLIGEGLAQYAAMRILEEMEGPESVETFLRFNREHYLEERGRERLEEMPLYRVENQAYLHYHKASLAFDALADEIGSEAIDRALRAFVDEKAFAGPPYPTSRDLLRHLRGVVPAGIGDPVGELFETVAPLDNAD